MKFLRAPQGFVGTRLFPVFGSGEQSSDYYVFNAENLLLAPRNTRHTPGTAFHRITMTVSDDNFNCKDYGLEQPVPDDVRKKYAKAFDADIAAVRQLTNFIMVGHEQRVKALATDPAKVPNAGVGVKWDLADSNPKEDVNAAREEIRKSIGAQPNTMVISRPVVNVLEVHPKIADLFKYTAPGVVTADKLATYFGVPNILIADQVVASNQEGQALTAADIWGDDVLLAHVQPGQDLSLLNFGRTFYWNQFGAPGEADVPMLIESYRDDTVKSDVHRAQHYTDEKLVGADAGYLLTDVLA